MGFTADERRDEAKPKDETEMTVTKYCEQPDLYQNLPKKTRMYYDRICMLKQDISDQWKEELGNLGQTLLEAPHRIMNNILSPKGMEMMGIFLGVDITAKAAMNGILRGIAKGVGENVMELAAEQATKEGALFINSAIITSVLGAAVEEGTVAATAFAITTAVGSSVSAIASIVMIIQFLGSLIDMWDRNLHHYKQHYYRFKNANSYGLTIPKPTDSSDRGGAWHNRGVR